MKPRIGKQQNWLHLSVVVAGLVFLTAGSVPGALEAHYRFNGNLRDETGRHDGKLCDPKSSPRFDLGKSGEALIIDSFGSAVEVANPGGIDLSRDFTIAAWINTVFAQEEVVVFKGHANGFKVPDKQFNLMGGQGPFIYAEDQGQWGASYEATHRIHLDDGNWHHVAVTYRSSQTPHFALYVDGLAKKPGDEGSFMRGDFVMQPDSSNSVARIGARANDDYPYFRGLLDEVQIYNQALDADQVRFLFQHPGADLDTRSVPHFPTAGRIEWDPGHPWRPPFGLDRIGQPCKAVVKLATDDQPLPDCWVTGYLAGKEIERHDLRLSGQSPFKVQVTMSKYPDELALFVRNGQGEPVELARQPVPGKAFEADAIAKPDTVVNPVDLGAILPPADRLCLGPGESGSVDVAALSRAQDIHNGRIQVWFDSDPSTVVAEDLELTAGQPARFHLGLPNAAEVREQDVLDVAITGSEGNELWRKQIKTMRVIQAPDWPKFGATETKLRYDAPISLLNRETGVLSTMPYAEGWSPDLKDVVVTFHNGSRLV
ncbi:MAG: LamG domain-containing protein, partial [Candidatus Omnitrophica bacterium]|nr:LamG domain-containing protein [Candidatus Omnitrophota bacterium]